jgi:hypothetical protein
LLLLERDEFALKTSLIAGDSIGKCALCVCVCGAARELARILPLLFALPGCVAVTVTATAPLGAMDRLLFLEDSLAPAEGFRDIDLLDPCPL